MPRIDNRSPVTRSALPGDGDDTGKADTPRPATVRDLLGLQPAPRPVLPRRLIPGDLAFRRVKLVGRALEITSPPVALFYLLSESFMSEFPSAARVELQTVIAAMFSIAMMAKAAPSVRANLEAAHDRHDREQVLAQTYADHPHADRVAGFLTDLVARQPIAEQQRLLDALQRNWSKMIEPLHDLFSDDPTRRTTALLFLGQIPELERNVAADAFKAAKPTAFMAVEKLAGAHQSPQFKALDARQYRAVAEHFSNTASALASYPNAVSRMLSGMVDPERFPSMSDLEFSVHALLQRDGVDFASYQTNLPLAVLEARVDEALGRCTVDQQLLNDNFGELSDTAARLIAMRTRFEMRTPSERDSGDDWDWSKAYKSLGVIRRDARDELQASGFLDDAGKPTFDAMVVMAMRRAVETLG